MRIASYLHSFFSIPVESKWKYPRVWTGSVRFLGRLPTVRGLVSHVGAGRSGRMCLGLILGFNCSRERIDPRLRELAFKGIVSCNVKLRDSI